MARSPGGAAPMSLGGVVPKSPGGAAPKSRGGVVPKPPGGAAALVGMAMAAVAGTTVVTASDTTDMDNGVMTHTMRTARVNTMALRRAVDEVLDSIMRAERDATFKVLPAFLSRGWLA